MRYLVRSAKYFVHMGILLSLILLVLSKLGFVEGNASEIFRNGTDSIWQIALLLLVFSLAYPRFGYVSRGLIIPGEYSEVRGKVISYMQSRGYALEKEEGEDLSFRKIGVAAKVLRFWEDKIVFTRCMTGFEIEGKSKDVAIIWNGLSE